MRQSPLPAAPTVRIRTSGLARCACAVLAMALAAGSLQAADDGARDRVANVEAGNVPAAVPAESVAAAEPDSLTLALRGHLATSPPKLSPPDKDDRDALAAFYAGAEIGQLWVTKSGFKDRAHAAMAEIGKAADWGLSAADFSLPRLDGSSFSDDDLAIAEVRLSLAVLKYARHARGGRIADPTTQLSSYIDRKPQLKDPRTVLEEISKAPEPDAYLRDLHPKHSQFVKLREALLAMRSSAEAEKEIVKVPAKGPQIQPGKNHPDVALVRKRLDVPVPSVDGQAGDETLYDEALQKAVVAFQEERGLKSAKGVINQSTRNALNAETMPAISEKKIVANMEAWRWMPEDLGDTYVWVNIPEFTVRVVKGGQVIHAERVITGKVDTQTPIFSDMMETVVIHPFWGVPESIKVKELYPGLARGGDTLSRNGLRIQYNGRDVSPQSVDWTTANIKNFHVYQPPGPGNVLGVVKFLFPNKHQVYMHDTPTKHLFATQMRTYSHGCMRVRNPVRLAEVLLGADKGWDGAKIQSLIKGGPQNNEIALTTKVPVHVTYFTTWVGDDGKLGASKDFYGHEQRVSLALDGKWTQIARGRDHLAPVRAEPIARLAESSAKYQPGSIGDLFKAIFGGN
mgnify:CR=1 FL=1